VDKMQKAKAFSVSETIVKCLVNLCPVKGFSSKQSKAESGLKMQKRTFSGEEESKQHQE